MGLSLLMLMLTVFGCRVQFNFTGGGTVDERLETLNIEIFTNEATVVVPYLAQEITRQMQERFLNQSRLELTSGDADIFITGAITRYQVSPVAISGNTRAEQSRLTMAARITFENRVEPSESWEQTFSKFVDFNADEDFTAIERDLIDDLLEQITQDVFTKSVANW